MLSPTRRANDLDAVNEECRFKPEINTKSAKMMEQQRKTSQRRLTEVFDQLYQEKIEIEQKKALIKYRADCEREQNLMAEVTFKPKITSYRGNSRGKPGNMSSANQSIQNNVLSATEPKSAASSKPPLFNYSEHYQSKKRKVNHNLHDLLEESENAILPSQIKPCNYA